MTARAGWCHEAKRARRAGQGIGLGSHNLKTRSSSKPEVTKSRRNSQAPEMSNLFSRCLCHLFLLLFIALGKSKEKLGAKRPELDI
jgi:hypothetical protein